MPLPPRPTDCTPPANARLPRPGRACGRASGRRPVIAVGGTAGSRPTTTIPEACPVLAPPSTTILTTSNRPPANGSVPRALARPWTRPYETTRLYYGIVSLGPLLASRRQRLEIQQIPHVRRLSFGLRTLLRKRCRNRPVQHSRRLVKEIQTTATWPYASHTTLPASAYRCKGTALSIFLTNRPPPASARSTHTTLPH